MNRIGILVLTASLIGCATSDYEPPRDQARSRPPIDTERASVSGMDMLPPADWWHQPIIAEAVHLTSDQMSALDKIARDQWDDIARLERDIMVAARDLRQVLDSNQPSSTDIVSAAQRLRALRDTLFDRQVEMLAAERQVLSQQQWQTLQDQLQSRRSRRNQDELGPRRGGRGMGGRGRRPGF